MRSFCLSADAQLACIEMDGKNFPEIKTLLDQAKQSGDRLILARCGLGGPKRRESVASPW